MFTRAQILAAVLVIVAAFAAGQHFERWLHHIELSFQVDCLHNPPEEL